MSITDTLGPLAPLAALPQFILVKRDGKIPVSPLGRVGVNAHDPRNWQPWAEADAAARAWGGAYGVGFVLTAADPFWCLDIDGALQPDGTWSQLSQQLCAALPGTAVETSQSGRGLHIWGQGPVPPHSSKNIALGVELYDCKRFILLGDTARAVGQMVPGIPGIADVAAKLFPPKAASAEVPDEGPRADWVGPTDDDELVRRAMASRSNASVFGGKATFADLWNGAVDALARTYPDKTGNSAYDASSADMALAQHLAFWTGCDVARMERLMRRSALVRDKWDQRDQYLVEWTITGACEQCREVYRDPQAAQAVPAQAPGPAGVPAAPGGPVAAVSDVSALSLSAAQRAGGSAALQWVLKALAEVGLIAGLDRFTGRKLVWLAPDSQHARILPRVSSTVPRVLEPEDSIELREYLQIRGFKPIAEATMQDALARRAREFAHDSAVDWGNRLVWDGVPRIDTFAVRYWGAADMPYSRAVGAYCWTALAGRLMHPGVKADMAPILVGGQGVGKSTAVMSMAPSPDHFGELDFERDEVDLIRQLRGKLLLEMPELRGMRGKDQRALKSFVARAVDEWVPKYLEDTTRLPRRCLFIGTTNESEFLDDPTGERRWLPIEVGALDIDAIMRDCEQLWAEGIVRFQANGVEWQQAQDLARDEHHKFKELDPWTGPVEAFLAKNPGPVTSEAVGMGAGVLSVAHASKPDRNRLAAVIRSLGYTRKDGRLFGMTGRPWVQSKG